jgi:two-component system, NtrC family, sensor histidine kinase HydH
VWYALPVVVAALREGWRGGVIVALISGVLLVVGGGGSSLAARAAETSGLVCLAAAAGLLSARERQQRIHSQKVAEQLSSVYEKVQANFEAMKRAERLSALGQLSAGLAHEIRNPLASISGAASILQRSNQQDARLSKCVKIITRESQRLDGLLTNFLNFARPRPPRFQSTSLDTVLDNVLGLASHGIRGKSVKCEKKLDPGLPLVECDPEQLEQVLLNLMLNAIEASPVDETVTLSAALSPEPGKVAIRVADRGHGVALHHIDRLFDPFFTTKEHGTGLGLPVAHQIVTQMGGTLMAEFNPGGGMLFSVILPVKHGSS